MPDETIQYQDVVLNTLKSKTVIGTDANGKIVTGEGLAGTKVYYVADTSGGAVTRKLTFLNGVLTSET